ncbi:MAG: hypothetical protein MZV64_53695 [Ignavibacteriales bacterium]|nr:hypothetical protein [Ignavibacteriales bacterium]
MAMRLPLRWIAMLYGKVNADLAATSGIYSAEDVLKMVMAGAKVTQMLISIIKVWYWSYCRCNHKLKSMDGRKRIRIN